MTLIRRKSTSYFTQKDVQDDNINDHTKKTCNICNGSIFSGGPGGRLSRKLKFPPLCEKCKSLERHRSFRSIFERIVDASFQKFAALQFSKDMVIDSGWFMNHEISIYGGENSLDLQKIEKLDKSYDVVVCNHVLEHVENDTAALKELSRIVKDDGFLFLSVPDPLRRIKTEDWGYPRQDQHGHYRMYGKDFENYLKMIYPKFNIISCIGKDPVTFEEDIAYIITRSKNTCAKLSKQIGNAYIL